MTAQAQPQFEKTWREKLNEFLIDEFHYELYRVSIETSWSSDVMVGAWAGPIEFFRCLDAQHKYIIANQSDPELIRSHLQIVNFSGQETVNGPRETFLSSQLPCNRQKILLLHSLRLLLENNDRESVNLSLIVPIIRRELHQCIRLVFSHLANGPHAKGLEDFVDEITQFEWLPINDVRIRLENHLVSWLEELGVDRSDLDDSNKLGKFWRTLSKYVHYRPGMNEPVEFKYGHLFSDWQKFGFCTTLIYEIGRWDSLVNLERLSHESHLGSESGAGQLSQLGEERPLDPYSRNTEFTTARLVLAIHYLLDGFDVDLNNKSAETRFIRFLIDRDESDIKRKLTEIRERGNPADKRSKKALPRSPKQRREDLRFIRPYFEDLKLVRITNAIDDEVKSIDEEGSVELS